MVTLNDPTQPLVPVSFPSPSLASYHKDKVASQNVEVLHEKRQHTRIGFKVPVMLHNATWAPDCSITEDVSRGGFCFASDRYYIVGEVVLISIRCGFGNAAFQADACIVRREELGTTGRTLYGANYLGAGQRNYFSEEPAARSVETCFASLPT